MESGIQSTDFPSVLERKNNYLCMLSGMRMKSHRDNAEFLHLFSEVTDGVKFLTHESNGAFDYVDYVYRCQQIVLSKRAELEITDSLYDLVRGFVFGPEWTDYKGEVHRFFVSSEEAVSFFEDEEKHPLNSLSFKRDFEDFRNSIRFRSGRLDLFFRNELSKEFPSLEMNVSGALRGADMYTETGAVRSAIRLILKSMEEYGEHPRVAVDFTEDEVEGDLLKSTLVITQEGSFPAHSLQRDMGRLDEGDGGTFGTIRKTLDGLCEWAVCSNWPDREGACLWRILRNETEPELSPADQAKGFSHIISIYHKP